MPAVSRFLFVMAAGICCLATAALAQEAPRERVDQEMIAKIREEGLKRSQIMETLSYLTDVYGPRLTGSPNLKAAGEWAVQQMTSWGLKNGHLEPWDFGYAGWANERVTAHMTTPVKDALVVEVLAWTPGTTGVARGQAVQILPPARPTATELTSFLDGIKSTIAGKMVLVGPHQSVPVSFNAVPLRREDADVVTLLNEYFDLMVEIVFKHRGILDKFIGDALMAVWGAPTPQSDDAKRAVAAALDMQATLTSFNEFRRDRGEDPTEAL